MSQTSQERRGRVVESFIQAIHLYQVNLRLNGKAGDVDAFADTGRTAEERAVLLREFDTLVATGADGIARWVEQGDAAEPAIGRAVNALLAKPAPLAGALPVSRVAALLRARAPQAEPAGIRALASLYQLVLEVERDGTVLPAMFKIYIALKLPVFLDEIGLAYDTADFIAMAELLAVACCAAPVDTSLHSWQLVSRKIKNLGERHTGKVTAEHYADELAGWPEVAACADAVRKWAPRRFTVLGHSFTMSAHWSSHASFTDMAFALMARWNPDFTVVRVHAGSMTPRKAVELKLVDRALESTPTDTIIVMVVDTEEHRRILQDIIRRLRSIGSRVYFFDALSADGYPLSRYPAAVPEAARQAGASIIEVKKTLENHPWRSQFLCLDECHMDPPYHKVMAAEFIKFLARAPGAC